MTSRSSKPTPAEKKAVEAVVRAAKQWNAEIIEMGWSCAFPEERRLFYAVARLLKEEAKTKEKRRAK